MKRLVRLFYFAISLQGTGTDSSIKSLLQLKNISNLGLPQSKIPPASFSSFESLSALSLSQCYLDSRSIVILSEALKHNRSLVKLDLSYNGLRTNIAQYLARALRINISLTMLSLAHNELDDRFCVVLAQELRNNNTLFECDMSGNPFAQDGANALLDLIGNTAVGSLGNLDQNKSLPVTAREALKGTLGVFKNEYKLLAPIEETNPYGVVHLLPWNLTNAIG
jgi:hypothetical protein